MRDGWTVMTGHAEFPVACMFESRAFASARELFPGNSHGIPVMG